jgi:hypothetical protein
MPLSVQMSKDDAQRLARYLLDEDALPDEIERYIRAIDAGEASLTSACQRHLWKLAMRSKLWLGLVDAGLALTEPYSPIRHRLCLMLAVLEASPAHTRCFIARPQGRVAFLELALRGLLATARSAVGILVVWSFRSLRR